MAFGGRRWPEELDVELREASGLCFMSKVQTVVITQKLGFDIK